MGLFQGKPAGISREQAQEIIRYGHHSKTQIRGGDGRWITTEDGTHLYIKDGKFYPYGPGSGPVKQHHEEAGESKGGGSGASEKKEKEPWEMRKEEYLQSKKGHELGGHYHGMMHKNSVAGAVAEGKLSLEKAQKMYPGIAEHPVVRGAIEEGKVKKPEEKPPNPAVKGKANLYRLGKQILMEGMTLGEKKAEPPAKSASERETDPRPGELASSYIDRMMGESGSSMRKAGNDSGYKHWLDRWTAHQGKSALDIREGEKKAEQKTLGNHRTWEEAHKGAQKLADDLGLDIAIRKGSKYEGGFNVSLASKNDSDYARAEIVQPMKKKETPPPEPPGGGSEEKKGEGGSPKLSEAYQEDYDKSATAMERQIGNETGNNRKATIVFSHLDGNPPAVQHALIKKLKEVAPDVVDYLNEDGGKRIPYRLKTSFKEALGEQPEKHARTITLEEAQDLVRYSQEKDGKVSKVMHEWGAGKLHSGSKQGPQVSSQKQALAIGFSEARKAGEDVPDKNAKDEEKGGQWLTTKTGTHFHTDKEGEIDKGPAGLFEGEKKDGPEAKLYNPPPKPGQMGKAPPVPGGVAPPRLPVGTLVGGFKPKGPASPELEKARQKALAAGNAPPAKTTLGSPPQTKTKIGGSDEGLPLPPGYEQPPAMPSKAPTVPPAASSGQNQPQGQPAATKPPKAGFEARRAKHQEKAAKAEELFNAMTDEEKQAHKAERDAKAAVHNARSQGADPGVLAQLMQAWQTLMKPAGEAKKAAAKRIAAQQAAGGQQQPAQGDSKKPAKGKTDKKEEEGENPFAGFHEQTMQDRWKRHKKGGVYQQEGSPKRYSKEECSIIISRVMAAR